MKLSKLLEADTYTRTRIFKVTLLGLAILFWQPLVVFYQRLLIEPVMSKVASSWLTDLVVGLGALLGGLLLLALVRQAYRLGLWQAVALAVPGLLYLAVRWQDGQLGNYHWLFTRFRTTSGLHYADLLVLPLG